MGLVSKAHRDNPLCEAWEERLTEEFGAILDDLDYPWESPVPPPETWDEEIEDYRRYLQEMGYDDA